MIVFRHLAQAYRSVYLWFWGIMAVILAGLAVSFEVFGHYTLDDERVSVWETVGQQAPRWFLFVMGIMFVTVNMPVAVANGVTRRAYYRAALLFSAVSAALFALALMAGFGVERTVYFANGMLAELKNPYPIDSFADAGQVGLETFVVLLAFMLSGWIVGLLYYRMHVWMALLLTPVAVFPISGVALPIGSPTVELGVGVATVAVAAAVGYALIRNVAVRNKKA